MSSEKLEIFLLLFIFMFNLFFLIFLIKPSLIGNVIYLGSEEKGFSDFITEEDIIIRQNQVIININNSNLTRYSSSGSMEPILNEKANSIVIVPKSPDDLNLGDIITYSKEGELIVHRIIKKGIDNEGVYFITKGDNNAFEDEKVRFSQIKSVIVAIVY